jgi:transposase-like protein
VGGWGNGVVRLHLCYLGAYRIRSSALGTWGTPGTPEIVKQLPDPQVVPKAEKAKRRKRSASEKRRILTAVDQASEPGEIGRILRREGIYHSQLSKWRKQRAAGIELGLSEKARGVKGPSVKTLQEENRKLKRRQARLEEELRRARLIIEFQKKAAALFEPLTASEES